MNNYENYSGDMIKNKKTKHYSSGSETILGIPIPDRATNIKIHICFDSKDQDYGYWWEYDTPEGDHVKCGYW